MKITVQIIFSILFFQLNAFSGEKINIEGNVKIMAVGEGTTGGMTSSVQDFKKLGLVLNFEDTLYSTLDENGNFKFDEVNEETIFKIHFFYQSTNEYLNRSDYFVPVNKESICPFNTHRNLWSVPLLSDYKIEKKNKIKTVFLHYAIYFFLSKPYEPAGFKLMEYPISTAHFQEVKVKGLSQIESNYFKGQTTVIPSFAMRVANDTLKPVYAGFSFQDLNIQNENGACFNGKVNQVEFLCDLKPLLYEIHSYFAQEEFSFNKITIGQSSGLVNFTPSVFFKIEKATLVKQTVTSTETREDTEPAHQLNFIICNQTAKTINVEFGPIKKYAAQAVIVENSIKKNQTAKVASVQFSMNNPLNYAAKIWLNSFPKELFETITFYYGKKKIPVAVSSPWQVAQNEMEFNYTLNVSF